MDFTRRATWPGGIDNKSAEQAMPEGFVRRLVNLDPLPGGVLGLRAGFEAAASGSAVRGAIGYRNEVVFADGDQLRSYNQHTDSTQSIATIAGAGRFSAAVFNDELFISTENQCLRYDGARVRRWGVPTVIAQPVPIIGAGGLPAGTYQITMTLLLDGDEGGTSGSMSITVPDNSSLTFSLPSGARLYVSDNAGSTPYLQYDGAGEFTLVSIDTSGARLSTQFMVEPQPADSLSSINGVIVSVDGSVLWHSEPFRPHLRSPMRAFFQYPSAISVMAPVAGGIYVCADKTYFLSGIETAEPNQSERLPYGAVAGTVTELPDGRVAWMTRYGIAVGDAQGSIALISEKNFAPEQASGGASGLLEYNGNQLVVTTLNSARRDNPLAATDYYEGEVITP
jgi:hypothetical protein